MSEDDKEPLTFLGKPIPRSFEEGLGDLSRQKRRITESPLTQSVRTLLDEINQKALKGAGSISTSFGETPADTVFSIEWTGKTTPMKKVQIGNATFTALPLHISAKPFKAEGEDWLRFKVTANYTGKDEDELELGVTEKLNADDLKTLIEEQIEKIRESAER